MPTVSHSLTVAKYDKLVAQSMEQPILVGAIDEKIEHILDHPRLYVNEYVQYTSPWPLKGNDGGGNMR